MPATPTKFETQVKAMREQLLAIVEPLDDATRAKRKVNVPTDAFDAIIAASPSISEELAEIARTPRKKYTEVNAAALLALLDA